MHMVLSYWVFQWPPSFTLLNPSSTRDIYISAEEKDFFLHDCLPEIVFNQVIVTICRDLHLKHRYLTRWRYKEKKSQSAILKQKYKTVTRLKPKEKITNNFKWNNDKICEHKRKTPVLRMWIPHNTFVYPWRKNVVNRSMD